VYTEDNDDLTSGKELSEQGYTLPEYHVVAESPAIAWDNSVSDWAEQRGGGGQGNGEVVCFGVGCKRFLQLMRRCSYTAPNDHLICPLTMKRLKKCTVWVYKNLSAYFRTWQYCISFANITTDNRLTMRR
jgi:hypothetical protein